MKTVAPPGKLTKMSRNARIFLLGYLAIAALIAVDISWPFWFLVLPRLLGAPVMLLFTLIQHVELSENSPSIIDSTRSFRTTWLGRFFYMNNHVEHHPYPQVPFHGLPRLATASADQVPAPDPGFFRSNWEVFLVIP